MDVFFIDLFEYDHSANQQWFEKLAEYEDLNRRPWDLMNHVASTKKHWWHRLQEEPGTDLDLWPDLAPDECESLLGEMHHRYINFLDETSDTDLEGSVTYRNSSGKTFETPVREILMHLLTHNHYHRGQIAQSVRQQGYEPIWTDYIVHSRMKSGQLG